MARITVEDCLDNVPNRFALVMLAARRTKQIMKGSNPMVDTKDNKFAVVALREIAANKVWFDYGSDGLSPNEQIEIDLTR